MPSLALDAYAHGVEAVAGATKATTGCGSCRGEVERLLADFRAEREREFARPVEGAVA